MSYCVGSWAFLEGKEMIALDADGKRWVPMPADWYRPWDWRKQLAKTAEGRAYLQDMASRLRPRSPRRTKQQIAEAAEAKEARKLKRQKDSLTSAIRRGKGRKALIQIARECAISAWNARLAVYFSAIGPHL